MTVAPAEPHGESPTTLLAVEDLVSDYGKVEVVSHVSLHAEAGETIGLLGRNGAGKSALMRTIMGLSPPVRRHGRIWFRGREITGRPPYEVAQIGVGYAPDDRKIFPHLTVTENLELARRLTPKHRSPLGLDEIFALFPLVHELRDRGGAGLSGGEQKMLAIARAMIQRPALLMLDETSEGLSPVMVQQLVQVLNSLKGQGVTMVLADQNLRFCAKVAARGYLLERGRIHLSGTIEEIWKKLSEHELHLMA